MNYHKLLLPFEKYHFPHLEKLSEPQKHIVEKLNSEIISGKYRFVERECLCGSKDFDIVATVDKNSILVPTVVCRNCGLIQTNPRFSEVFYRNLYTLNTFNELYYPPDLEHFVLERFSPNTGLHILKAIEKEHKIDENTKVLEVGSGAGWNLIPFIHRGAQVLGIDYNPDMVELAKKFGVPVVQGDETTIEGEYDIIIINHVLEHMPHPILSLLKITEHLKNTGIIYIGVPNILNFKLDLLTLPHIYYFSPYSLKYFASEANLVPIHIKTVGETQFYGIFKKGFYRNSQLAEYNISQTKKVLRKQYRKERLLIHKKIKSLEDVPAHVFFKA